MQGWIKECRLKSNKKLMYNSEGEIFSSGKYLYIQQYVNPLYLINSNDDEYNLRNYQI